MVAAIVRSVYCSDRRLQFVLLALMLLVYGVLLAISFNWRNPLDLTFNSMLDHLLRGRFDVDPQIVGYEGYHRDGHVYAYWGIFPALLRLPLWIVGRMDIDWSLCSCLAAVCIAAMAKVRAVLLLRRHALQNSMTNLAISLMLAYILFGGAEIAYLRVNIYQEALFWGLAFASVFVYLAVKGLVTRSFGMATLCGMALCAGLAVMTRISTGIGLTIALAFLLLALALEPGVPEAADRRPFIRRILGALKSRRLLTPIALLAVLIALTGTVNYFRWGNPATFVYPYRDSPDVSPMNYAESLGLFSVRRIPFGFIYYLFPVWVLRVGSGQILADKMTGDFFDAIELPPSSFLLTDLLPFCFIVLLAIALFRRRAGNLAPIGKWVAAIAVGLAVPCALMLTFIWMVYRYRMEFYPLIDFLALMALYLVVTDSAMLEIFARWRRWIAVALAVSILSSFTALFLYIVGEHAVTDAFLRQGIVGYYCQQFSPQLHKFMAHYSISHAVQ
jgi:hypothetical protein